MHPIATRTNIGRRALGATLVLLFVAGLTAHRQEAWGQDVKAAFVLVAHTDVGVHSIEREVLADIFLKQRTSWPDGSMAFAADQKPAATVRLHFSNQVLRRSVQAVRSYWQQRIFSGRGVPPPELDSDEAVIEYVRGKSGAVGYVSPRAELKGVKVLTLR